MRKKSHICLAKYIVENVDTVHNRALLKYRKSFYWGNLLPDLKPDFITERHEYDQTFQMVKNRMTFLIEQGREKTADGFLVRELGEIIHYLADYFTFPHNKTYEGTLREHCRYEKELKFGLRQYVQTQEAKAVKNHLIVFDSLEKLVAFIEKKHSEYLQMKRNVEEDCRYIVQVCMQAVNGLLHLCDKGLLQYG